MKELITVMMTRLFAGGAICTVALILTGGGAKREIVRLCCACLMIILVLTPVKGASINLSDILEPAKQVEGEIDASLNEARQTQLAQIEAALADYIIRQAAVIEISCTAKVVCDTDSDGQAYIRQVVVYTSLAEPDDRLEAMISGDLGISRDRIMQQKGGN